MSKISISFYPNDAKKSSSSFRTPLYLRIRKNRLKCEVRLNWDLSAKERKSWNETLQLVESKVSKTNDYINRIQEKFEEIKILNAYELDELDIHNLKHVLSGQSNSDASIPTILGYAKEYYEKNVKDSTKLRIGTKKNYAKAIRHLENFCEKTQSLNSKVTKLNFSFVQDFSNYLMADYEPLNKKAMAENSACGNIKKFRTIFKQAVIEKYFETNPFNSVTLSYQSPRKPKLSLSQVQKFFNYHNLPEADQINGQIFLFMSLTGTAYLDCMNLTMNQLEYTREGLKLTYTRVKTGHVSSQYLTTKAIELLEIFDKMPDVQNSEFLVPQRSNQFLNRSLKLIAQRVGIAFTLTSHHGRHTFRSLLDESDVVDPTVISKLMGWSTGNSMDAIYRDVTDRRLVKTKNQLDIFINLTFSHNEHGTENF